MRMNYFSYDVRCYEYDNYDKQVVYSGIVCAANYGDATNQVVEYYGADVVIDVKVAEWDVGSGVLELSPEVKKAVEKDDGGGVDYEG